MITEINQTGIFKSQPSMTDYMETLRMHVRKIKKQNKIKNNLERLEYSIVSAWRKRVETDFTESPIDTDERFEELDDFDKSALLKNPVKAYGSTFIAAVLSKNFCSINVRVLRFFYKISCKIIDMRKNFNCLLKYLITLHTT